MNADFLSKLLSFSELPDPPDWLPENHHLRQDYLQARRVLRKRYDTDKIVRLVACHHSWLLFQALSMPRAEMPKCSIPRDAKKRIRDIYAVLDLLSLPVEKAIAEVWGVPAAIEHAISEKTSAAARKRHQPNLDAKARARELYRTGAYESKEAAVKDIIPIIRYEFPRVLSDDDEKARATVLDWLVRKDRKRPSRMAKTKPS